MAPKEFIPTSPNGTTGSRIAREASRRERMYQMVIWCMVIWNVALQWRSLAVKPHMPSAEALPSFAYDPPRTGGPDDEPAGTFANPATSDLMGGGSAGVVCSGCTNDGSNSSGASGANASVSAATTSLETLAAGSANSSAAGGSEIAATADVGASTQLGWTPVVPKAPKPVKPSAVSLLPPIPSGLPEGAPCSSGFKNDGDKAQCLSFCISKYARAHCQRCKCKGCAFCPKPEPAAVDPAAAAPNGTATTSVTADGSATAATAAAPADAAAVPAVTTVAI